MVLASADSKIPKRFAVATIPRGVDPLPSGWPAIVVTKNRRR